MSSGLKFDVIVAGGGPSGIMAAISAARLGCRVLLIERYGFLGGMNTAGFVGPLMTFHAGNIQIVRGIADEIIEDLKAIGGTPGHLIDPIWANTSLTPVDTELYKIVLARKMIEAGVELLLHSMVTAVERKGDKLVKAVVSNKQGNNTIEAKFFIDATGDGDLAASMGCNFVHGRSQDNLTQPMSLMVKLAGVNEARIREYIRENPNDFYLGFDLETYLSLPALAVSGYFGIVKKGREDGSFPFDRDRVLFFGLPRKGEVTVNTLRINNVSGVRPEDLTRAEMTLRCQVPALVHFMTSRLPGFENAYLTETAPQVGVRETRHILGDYLLKGVDILKQEKFSDVIAHASYPIDVHSPDGKGMHIVDPRKDNPDSYYDIPYRCLLPVGTDNLLVTGRCISAEHEASASARISATCMALGEACGVAVAQAVSMKLGSLRDVNITQVQTQLKKQGAYLR